MIGNVEGVGGGGEGEGVAGDFSFLSPRSCPIFLELFSSSNFSFESENRFTFSETKQQKKKLQSIFL